MPKLAKGQQLEKKWNNVFKNISPDNLLIIFYQLTKFEAAIYIYYCFFRYLYYKFSMLSPGNLLIFFYQLTTLKAASYNNFWDILSTSFLCQKF